MHASNLMNLTILLNQTHKKAQILGLITGTLFCSILAGTLLKKTSFVFKGIMFLSCNIYCQYTVDRVIVNKIFDVLYPIFEMERKKLKKIQLHDRALLKNYAQFHV